MWAGQGMLGRVTTTTRAELRTEAEAHLRALVGREDAVLREDQWAAIEALVADRRRALVVQRTGWGKSAVYFVATALLRSAGAGPTVIVSPLLALMRNQIAAAERAGIRGVTINSTNSGDWADTYAAIHRGEVDVLLVSPERLNNPEFRDEVLPRLAAAAGLLVVDEAHCISDWGHDFRPDYRRIRTMLADLPDGIPVLATTATANARVTADVAEQLSVTGTDVLDDVLVLRGALDRESLHLAVVELPSQAARLAWLAEHLGELPGPGIIYCLTVAATQEVAEHLRGAGYDAAAYSGQTDPAERLAAEDALLSGRLKALVATSALGMGFDMPDLGWVVNLGAPASPIAYYQQVGRAGRAIDRAVAVLLPGREDRDIWDYFGSLAFPPEPEVRQALAVLGRGGPAAVDRRPRAARHAAPQPAGDDAQGPRRRRRRPEGPRRLGGDRRALVVRRRPLRPRPGDPPLGAGGDAGLRRDHRLPDGVPAPRAGRPGRRSRAAAATAAAASSSPPRPPTSWWRRPRSGWTGPGVAVEPRRLWPTGLAASGCRCPARSPRTSRPSPAGRWPGSPTSGGAGRCTTCSERARRTASFPCRCATRWSRRWTRGTCPGGRPDGLVPIGSATRPQLVAHLADGLSRYLDLPVLARFDLADPDAPSPHDVNSAQRLRAVASRHRLSDPAAVAGRRVLLLDDRTDSGWTLAVCARALRLAGATAAYPLVLAATT